MNNISTKNNARKASLLAFAVSSMMVAGCTVTAHQPGSGSSYDGDTGYSGSGQTSAFGGRKKSGVSKPAPAQAPEEHCFPMSHLRDNKDGTFTDSSNGVVWQKCRNGEVWASGACTGTYDTTTYNNALESAKKSRFLGKSDWRLPTVDEFLSLDRRNLGKSCAYKGLHSLFKSQRHPEGYGDGTFWTTDIHKNRQHERSTFDTTWIQGQNWMVQKMFGTGAGYQWRIIGNSIMVTNESVSGNRTVNGYVLVRGGGNAEAFDRDVKTLGTRKKNDQAQIARIEKAQQAARLEALRKAQDEPAPSYSANTYCAPSDTCFVVVSNERSRAKIKCTKGTSYKIGQTYDICAASNGKWGNCGVFGVSGDYTFTVAGNKACD